MSLSTTQDKATAHQNPPLLRGALLFSQRPLSNKRRGTPLPHLYYDSPPLPFISPFLTLFQCALDFTPHCHVDVFLQRLAFVPSLLKYIYIYIIYRSVCVCVQCSFNSILDIVHQTARDRRRAGSGFPVSVGTGLIQCPSSAAVPPQ